MRETITALASLLAGAALLGGAAGPASADVPNPLRTTFSTPGVSFGESCQNGQSYGVKGQYGAWGYFVDGCTVGPLRCPAARGCLAKMHTSFSLFRHRGERVTQNARLRRFTYEGQVFGWSDKSCEGIEQCVNDDVGFLAPGQMASVQCNGVYGVIQYLNEGVNVCRLEIVLL